VGATARHHPDEPERALADHQALKAAAAERHIQQLVATWPPLTAAQRNRLATLLTTATDPPAPPPRPRPSPPPPLPPDPDLLAALAAHPGATSTQLAALLGWPTDRVRRVLRRLDATGRAVGTWNGPAREWPTRRWRQWRLVDQEGAGDG
jgi:hypothetical protein